MFLGTLRAEMNYLMSPPIFSCLVLIGSNITGDHQRQPEAVLNLQASSRP